MKVRKVIIKITLIIVGLCAYLFRYQLIELFDQNNIRGLTEKELVERPLTYDFKFCDSCKTYQDVLKFQKQIGAKQIKLRHIDANQIFNNNRRDSDGNLDYNYKYHDLFFLRENPKTMIREITHYVFDEGDFTKNLSKVELLRAKLWIVEKKFFYRDDIFNKLYPSSTQSPFDFNKMESLFYELAQVYRKKCNGEYSYLKDWSTNYVFHKGKYGEDVFSYSDRKKRKPFSYIEYRERIDNTYIYTTSKKIPHLMDVVKYTCVSNEVGLKGNTEIHFTFSKSNILKEPFPNPMPIDYVDTFENIEDQHYAVFFKTYIR